MGVLSVDAIERIAIPVWFLFLELQYGVKYGVLQRPVMDFSFGSTCFRCRAQVLRITAVIEAQGNCCHVVARYLTNLTDGS